MTLSGPRNSCHWQFSSRMNKRNLASWSLIRSALVLEQNVQFGWGSPCKEWRLAHSWHVKQTRLLVFSVKLSAMLCIQTGFIATVSCAKNQGPVSAVILRAIPPVFRKWTLAALQKIGKMGSDLPFAALCTKVRYGPSMTRSMIHGNKIIPQYGRRLRA